MTVSYSKTAFSASNFEDSKRAHLAAQEQFYPQAFPGLQLTFEDKTKTEQDLEYAIDCRLAVTVDGFRAPLYFAVQERWRFDLTAMKFGDITVTEWNLASGLPSELHKLGAHLFVYGFYDRQTERILAGVIVSVPRLLSSLANGLLPYTRESRGDQSFLAFKLKHLDEMGALINKINLHRET